MSNWENSLYFAIPLVVLQRNDVWETRAKIPYWYTHHYPDLGSTSYWSCPVGNLLQPKGQCCILRVFLFFFLRGIHVWQYYNLNQVTSLVHVTGNCNVWFVNSNSSICSGGSRPSDKGVPRHPDPDIRWWGGPGLKRKIFQPFGPSVWSKNKGGLAPLDPPLVCDGVCIYHITV